jgi:hypothetical protein
MKRITPIHLEWNQWNHFTFEILGLEIEGYEGNLLGLAIGKGSFISTFYSYT